jgi:hypothetical protein
MNWKGYERKQSWSHWNIILAIARRIWQKRRNLSVRVAGVPSEVRIGTSRIKVKRFTAWADLLVEINFYFQNSGSYKFSSRSPFAISARLPLLQRKFYFTIIRFLSTGPPLWSSGQCSWRQIQRSSGSGTGSTQPREDNWGATWMEK